MEPPDKRNGRPRQETAAATSTTYTAEGTAQVRLPVIVSTKVFIRNLGRIFHTVAVEHAECRQTHLHRTTTLAPFVRRALCGRGRYRVIPVGIVLPYGRDDPDTGHWADETGTVFDADDRPVRRAS